MVESSGYPSWLIVFRALRRQHAQVTPLRKWIPRIVCIVTWCAVIAVWIANRARDDAATVIARIILSLPLTLLAIAFGPLMSTLRRRIAVRQWDGLEHQHGQHVMETTGMGFNLCSPLWSTAYRWEAIQEVQETRDVLVLKVARLAFLMVPKRAFANVQECELFKWMAREKRTVQPPPMLADLPTAQLHDPAPNGPAAKAQ